MKKARRFAAIAAAAIMTASLALPMSMSSFAADNVSLTLTSPELPADATIANVKAVQIFTGSTTEGQFSVDDWGTDVTPEIKAALATAAGVSGETDASKVALALDKKTEADTVVKDFAKTAALKLGGATGATAGTYNESTQKYDFGTLSDGYYVVVCEAKGDGDEDWKASSLGMLTVIDGNAEQIGTGKAKVGLPKAVKKVKENNADNTSKLTPDASVGETDKAYNDVADWNIGDAVPFRLYGTLPDDYDKYDSYFYQFNDSLDSQFTMPETVTVTIKDTPYAFTKGSTGYTSADVTDGGIVVTAEGNKLTVKIPDLKKYIDKKSTTETIDVVTVDYSAVLNATANAGMTGQENKVTLTYSNNPNQESHGETDSTGETPEDKVIVFTYDMKFQKSFWNGNSELTQQEIEDGTYSDLKFTVTTTDKDGNTKTIKVKEVEAGSSDVGKYDYVVTSDNDGITEIPLVLIDSSTGLESATGDKLVIRIKGLDDGEYTIKESEADGGKAGTAGYETDEEITATLTGATNNTNDDYDKTSTEDAKKPITSDTEGYNVADGEYGDVKNNKGLELPSTGGIGTTLFYVVGGALVAGAGVTLITKKRINDSAK